MRTLAVVILTTVSFLSCSSAFQSSSVGLARTTSGGKSKKFQLHADVSSTSEVESYLQQYHGVFWGLLMAKNDDVWKKLRDSGEGSTIFAPTDEAIVDLGDKKIEQLQDIRNEETVMKMGAFHAVPEPVSSEELFRSAGVIPVAVDVIPVEPSVSGGFFGVGGKEDGGVTVGGAKVVESLAVGNCIIHRMDGLVSPSILWRYCDQLRIPGSK